MGLTIIVQRTWRVDDVVIVQVESQRILLQRDLARVLIRNEMEEVRSRSRGPILGEIAELSDVISEEVDRWFHEGDVEDPVATNVPLERGGHLAGDLIGDGRAEGRIKLMNQL